MEEIKIIKKEHIDVYANPFYFIMDDESLAEKKQDQKGRHYFSRLMCYGEEISYEK